MDQNKMLKPGDLIEITRQYGYQHWAIYVGDGYVIHVVSASGYSSSGSSSGTSGKDGKATVKKEKLQDVVGSDEYCINNCLDDQYEPHPVEDILQKAEGYVGREFSYNVATNNCEHLATLLRYGKPQSQQVDQARNILIAGLIAAGVVFGILTLAKLRKEDNQDQ